MKRLFLLLLLVLLARLPLNIWDVLTEEERIAGIQEIARDYAQKESCHKVKVSIGKDKEFIYLQFECVELKL